MVSGTRSVAGHKATVPESPQVERVGLAAHFVVRAAILAPSVHNTQPWRFTGRPDGLELWADRTRLLPTADPGGRELVISCGAALFNARLAVRHLGFSPRVRLLPDPAHPDLLARITWGPRMALRPYEDLLYRTMPQRHTHLGPFVATPLPPKLPTVLSGIARHEGAGLRIVPNGPQRLLLAEQVQVAEAAQRRDPRFAGELLAWATSPGSRRGSGLAAGSYPLRNGGLDFVARDYAAASPLGLQFPADRKAHPRAVGTVAVLTTREDRRVDWLLAGQALQHVLLHAATVGVSAAFHTQPLELPYLRAVVRRDLVCGHPQMVLRLGHAARTLRSPRRPVADVLTGTGLIGGRLRQT